MSKYPGRVLSATPPAVSTSGASGIWTQEEVAQYNAEGVWPAQPLPYDPYFQNTVLLLHGDGNQGATNFSNISDPVYLAFKDNSSNNFPITVNGDAYGDNFGPYALGDGYWSNYFDGSGDYLTVPSNAAFDQTGNFTVQCWVYLTASPSNFVALFGEETTNYIKFTIDTNRKISINQAGLGVRITGSTAIPLNTWTHLAFVKSGTDLTAYFNAVSDGTGTISGSSGVASANTINIGREPFLGSVLTGYISNLRVSQNAETITLPTAPLTAISGTSLLTCQSNRFVDNSTNNFAITPAGNVAVKVFNPFGELPDSVNGSGYFVGDATDHLTAPADSAFALGSNSFTLEAWIYPLELNTYNFIYSRESSGSWSDTEIEFQFNSSGTLAATVAIGGTPTAVSSATGAIKVNQWQHIAFVRNGTSGQIYVNGAASGSAVTISGTLNNAGSSPYINYQAAAGSRGMVGWLSNLRLVNGSAVYTSAFTPPTAPLTAVTNTSLLTCQYAGTVRNVGFIDSGPYDFPITRYGNTTQGTFSPFSKPDGAWGNYFDGSGDHFAVIDNAAFAAGTGDFEISFWLNTPGPLSTFDDRIMRTAANNTAGSIAILLDAGTNYVIVKIGSTNVITGTVNVGDNEWHYVSVSRSGSSLKLFVDGVEDGSATNSTDLTTTALQIGQDSSLGADYDYLGYLSNFRFVVGSANRTSAYTVPTTPDTAITNTQILTCQSNRFVDNSSNGFAMTAEGNLKVTPFSPFPLTTAYTPTLNGGAAYLDGTGDFLTVGTTINWSTFGNYTLEFWAYHVTLSTNVWYLVSDDFSAGETGWYVYSDGSIAVGINTVNQIVSSAGAVKAGQWQHIAYTYDGTTTKIYVNGVEVASGTTAVYANVSASISTGTGGGNTLVGYLSGMRIVDSVVYSSAFTPPTAPPTAISGTEVLLNFTNAGILDNTGFNALETVGNAQVDTSVVKFGTGSMKFDGTGDWLIAPSTDICNFGSGDFTIEFWLYANSTASTQNLIDPRPPSTTGAYTTLYLASGGTIRLFTQTSDRITSSATLSTGVWYHIALARASGSTKLFIGGSQEGSTYSDSNVYVSSRLIVGAGYANTAGITGPLNGYIDDLRITKGVARYTTTFDPPTQAFRNIGA